MPFLAFGASAGSSISGSLSNIYSLLLPQIALMFAQFISLTIPILDSSLVAVGVYFAWFGIWSGIGSPLFPSALLSTFYPGISTTVSFLSSFLASWTLASSIPVGMTGLISSSSAPATLVLVPVGLSSFAGGLVFASLAASTPVTAASALVSAFIGLVSQLSLAPIFNVLFGIDMSSVGAVGLGPFVIFSSGVNLGIPYAIWGGAHATSLGVALSFYLPSSVLSINLSLIHI